MGILRLLPYIRQHYNHVLRPINLEDIKGRRIWVDVHGPLYRCAYATPGDVCAVVKSFLAFNQRLREAGAKTVLVFDSPTPTPEKVEHCLLQRRSQREVIQLRRQTQHQDLLRLLQQLEEQGAKQPTEEATAPDQVGRRARIQAHFARGAVAVPMGTVQAILDALDQQGEDYRISRWGDAEEEAAKAARPCDLVASDDLDALIFGAPVLVRYIDRLGLPPPEHSRNGLRMRAPTQIHLSEFIESFRFEQRRQLIDFAILCGCDFAQKLHGLGPVRSHQIINEYGSIGRFRNSSDGRQFSKEAWQAFDYRAAQRIFERSAWAGGACTRKLSIDDARQVAASRDGKMLSSEYVNNSSKLLWQCVHGHQ